MNPPLLFAGGTMNPTNPTFPLPQQDSPGTNNNNMTVMTQNTPPGAVLQQALPASDLDASSALSSDNVAAWLSSFAAYQHVLQQQTAAAAAAAAAATTQQSADGSTINTTGSSANSNNNNNNALLTTAAAVVVDPSVVVVLPTHNNPTYVNAKQYRRILKRRDARRVLEEYYQRRRAAAEEKKPYMHESRHRHAMKRPRGPGGRFLTKDELVEYYKKHPEHDPLRMGSDSSSVGMDGGPENEKKQRTGEQQIDVDEDGDDDT